MPSSRGCAWPRDQPCLLHLLRADRFFTIKPPRKSLVNRLFPNNFLFIFLNKLLIGVQLFYRLCYFLVYSKVSQLHICIYPSFWRISFPFRSLQSTEWSSLCHTAGSHQLYILYMACVCIYIHIHVNPNLPSHLITVSPAWCPYICSLPLSLFLLCK